jgi:phosphate transport system permease protein
MTINTIGATDEPRARDSDVARVLSRTLGPADRVFRFTTKGIAVTVLVLTGSIGVFLGWQAIPTLRHYGLDFITGSAWQPEVDQVGIASVLVGTFQVALIAMVISFPLALLTALYISQYTAGRFKSLLVALVDLMAAVPSIIYGLWGFFLLQPRLIDVSHWLHTYLGFIPIFQVDTDPNAAAWAQSRYAASAFIAGVVVSMMVIPLAAAVMRGVFDMTPLGEREAAFALGSTKWGMVRTVVLPFGRGGIIGGTMLALGRALGETVAVLLIISPAFDVKWRPLEVGTETVSALIAGRFGEATTSQLSALLCAGFVLFLITLGTNTIAALFISRSRSGEGTEA